MTSTCVCVCVFVCRARPARLHRMEEGMEGRKQRTMREQSLSRAFDKRQEEERQEESWWHHSLFPTARGKRFVRQIWFPFSLLFHPLRPFFLLLGRTSDHRRSSDRGPHVRRTPRPNCPQGPLALTDSSTDSAALQLLLGRRSSRSQFSLTPYLCTPSFDMPWSCVFLLDATFVGSSRSDEGRKCRPAWNVSPVPPF